MKTGPIPISKKCGLCKSVKLLNQFEIDDKTKDKHATNCKDCFTKLACTGLDMKNSLSDMIWVLEL